MAPVVKLVGVVQHLREQSVVSDPRGLVREHGEIVIRQPVDGEYRGIGWRLGGRGNEEGGRRKGEGVKGKGEGGRGKGEGGRGRRARCALTCRLRRSFTRTSSCSSSKAINRQNPAFLLLSSGRVVNWL